ncbi:hypothetical protein ACFW2V_37795 [Streptomyces sp. NPDC058947]
MGSPHCRKYAKEPITSSAWTPLARHVRRELGRPVRTLKVMGLHADESRDHADHPTYRNILMRRAIAHGLPTATLRTRSQPRF